MRKFLSRIHIYAGLLCSIYLIIFGISSLNFNHRFSFMQPANEQVNWERSFEYVGETADDQQLADLVRDRLGLMGWTPPWRFKKDDTGAFNFDINRPGKQYFVRLDPARNKAIVVETRMGFWAVFNSLHALEAIPNSRFVRVWSIFTEVCIWFTLFAAASGLYFWTKRRDEKLIGRILLFGVTGGSFFFMLFIWLRG